MRILRLFAVVLWLINVYVLAVCLAMSSIGWSIVVLAVLVGLSWMIFDLTTRIRRQ